MLYKNPDLLAASARTKTNAKPHRAGAKPAKQKRNLLPARKSRRPSVPRKQSQPKTQAEIDVMRHRRVRTICRHPEREAMGATTTRHDVGSGALARDDILGGLQP